MRDYIIMTQFFICLLLLQIKRDPALGGSAKILREYQQSTEFQDLILAAIRDGASKVDAELSQKLGGLGAGLKIPGMF